MIVGNQSPTSRKQSQIYNDMKRITIENILFPSFLTLGVIFCLWIIIAMVVQGKFEHNVPKSELEQLQIQELKWRIACDSMQYKREIRYYNNGH